LAIAEVGPDEKIPLVVRKSSIDGSHVVVASSRHYVPNQVSKFWRIRLRKCFTALSAPVPGRPAQSRYETLHLLQSLDCPFPKKSCQTNTGDPEVQTQASCTRSANRGHGSGIWSRRGDRGRRSSSDVQNSIFPATDFTIWLTGSPEKLNSVRLSFAPLRLSRSGDRKVHRRSRVALISLGDQFGR
jgi:hypothetical protein